MALRISIAPTIMTDPIIVSLVMDFLFPINNLL